MRKKKKKNWKTGGEDPKRTKEPLGDSSLAPLTLKPPQSHAKSRRYKFVRKPRGALACVCVCCTPLRGDN